MSHDLTQRFSDRLKRPKKVKINDFESNKSLDHMIFSDQLNRDLLDHLCNLAEQIKVLRRDEKGGRFLKSLLDNKGAELYFTQSSTRTFKSFEKACQILGLEISETRDTSISSEYKGESIYDSIRMYTSYADILIMRSVRPNLAECCAYLMNDLHSFNKKNVPIINAGSGADEHPTQALLDIYTIYRSFEFADPSNKGTYEYDRLLKKYPELEDKKGGPDNKVYGFCGDVGRGRTVRSLVSILANNYKNVEVYFICPDHPKLGVPDELTSQLRNAGIKVHIENELNEEVVSKLDILYMTRIQNEHNDDEMNAYLTHEVKSRFFLTEDLVYKMKRYAKIMHPFPRNEEIETEVDKDERAIYFKQAKNGVWIRAALIAHLLEQDIQINNYYKEFTKEKHNYNEFVLPGK